MFLKTERNYLLELQKYLVTNGNYYRDYSTLSDTATSFLILNNGCRLSNLVLTKHGWPCMATDKKPIFITKLKIS